MRNATALTLLFVAALIAICGPWGAVAGAAPSVSYKIIVDPTNPSTTLDRKFIEHAFLKKISTWPGGVVIHPVDLPSRSPVRRRFTEDVFERSVDAVRAYWQQRIFAGRDVPPPEFETDDEIVLYVLKHEGAIGYVASGASVSGCNVVAVAR
jgi:ABC-type phosphate transport system substrate-binding protein